MPLKRSKDRHRAKTGQIFPVKDAGESIGTAFVWPMGKQGSLVIQTYNDGEVTVYIEPMLRV